MVTSHNVDLVREHGHGYIVGRNRRRSGEVFDYIQSATGPWIECPVGITAREKLTPPKTLVQEVASQPPGVRVFWRTIGSQSRESFIPGPTSVSQSGTRGKSRMHQGARTD